MSSANNMNQNEGRLLLAIPKKGRLCERVQRILKGSGLDYIRAERLDVAPCIRQPVTIVFLPAADIAKYVSEGNVDMGITGEDIIAESDSNVRAPALKIFKSQNSRRMRSRLMSL